MTEVSLEFIAQQIERVLTEQRLMRNQLASVHDQLTALPSIRDELSGIRNELYFASGTASHAWFGHRNRDVEDAR